jgi:hypothetical protein
MRQQLELIYQLFFILGILSHKKNLTILDKNSLEEFFRKEDSTSNYQNDRQLKLNFFNGHWCFRL